MESKGHLSERRIWGINIKFIRERAVEKVHSSQKEKQRSQGGRQHDMFKEGKLARGENEKPSRDQITQSWRPFKADGLGHNNCKKPPNPKALVGLPPLPLFSSKTSGIIEPVLSLFPHIPTAMIISPTSQRIYVMKRQSRILLYITYYYLKSLLTSGFSRNLSQSA